LNKDDEEAQTSNKILNNVVHYDPIKLYDMHIIVENIFERAAFYKIMPDYAKNIITGFGDVEGRVVGIVAN
jgi:propionyl-CoA carboxylase beta chain